MWSGLVGSVPQASVVVVVRFGRVTMLLAGLRW
jgi:hypothetical protein